MKDLKPIVRFLDSEMKVADFAADSANNGLQVENSGEVRKICCGVDASLDFFRMAKQRGADLLVCHHGISWGDSLKRITELNYRRISFLIENDMALYACHLPLDAHPRLGNNVLICKALGLRGVRGFGLYHGMTIGFEGKLPGVMNYADFKKLVRHVIPGEIRSMDFGKKEIRSVAVISGSAPDLLNEAGEKGIDVFLSGEPKLSAYSIAQEWRINAVFAGHYATETFGVQALAGWLKKKCGIPAEFIDMKVPY
ncbi:MAG: Nif3-like dinuclear metal center hexameric protein [Kiritimatiellae bacterium]|nr:Nif3-like dinuclear metal center hexameric protein [Kiritimatiellia bacterium]MDD5523024.1 Nif3-like dinuclear metal center hexameric protein [Kiritimatiellia bacterium]